MSGGVRELFTCSNGSGRHFYCPHAVCTGDGVICGWRGLNLPVVLDKTGWRLPVCAMVLMPAAIVGIRAEIK